MIRCLSDADVQAYLMGRVSDQQRSGIEGHLNDCADCAKRLESNRNSTAHSPAALPSPAEVEATWPDRRTDRESQRDGGSDLAGTVRAKTPHASISLDQFFVGLSQSGLLSAAEVTELREHSQANAASDTVDRLIDRLIGAGKLTPYQAEVLVRGQRGGLVLGNYVILSKLGAGGMGTVYQARHRRMNRLVALKVLPQALSDVPEAIARFQREVEAAARLQHPNIAAAYDADEAAGVHFLVMEFVDGPNLAAYVKQRGALALGLALRLMAQAARGLAAAHAQGIVHRDIKPSNLMVNRQGVVKVLDLGLAQLRGHEPMAELSSDMTDTGRVMGTVDYMAPEQARDAKTVDLRADIYSLGCTLYFLLTGRNPAGGKSAAEKLLWHQTHDLPPLSSVCPRSTARLDVLVKRMLAKSPDDRPASMHEVAEELLACAEDFSEPDVLELDGIPIAGDHASSVRSRSHYGQATIANLGDTVVAAGRGSTSSPRTPTHGNRAFQAAAFAGALILGGVLASPYVLPRLGDVAPAAPENALLRVSVPGEPAEVLVNGALAGITTGADEPLELVVPPGPQRVQIVRDGYEPHAVEIEARAGEARQVAATLRRVGAPAFVSGANGPMTAKLLDTVFRNGGKARLRPAVGTPLFVESLETLPKDPFDIDEIVLDGSSVRDDDLAVLRYAPQLTLLSLANTNLTDSAIVHLQPLQELRWLSLAQTRISSRSLPALAHLAKLNYLNLQETLITDEGLEQLAAHPRLKTLVIADTEVGDVGLAHLTGLSSLIELGASGTRLSESGYQALRAARGNLQIAWDGADPQRAVALKLLEWGATLAIRDTDPNAPREVQSGAELPLGRLVVEGVNLAQAVHYGDEDLQLLAALPDIERLALNGTRLSPAGLSHLYALKNLQHVDLGTMNLPVEAREALESKLGLTVVVRDPVDVEAARRVIQAGGRVIVRSGEDRPRHVSQTAQLPSGPYLVLAIDMSAAMAAEEEILALLDKLPQLETLVLTGKHIDNAVLPRIARCAALRDLTLSGTSVSGGALESLVGLENLESLYLANVQLGSAGIQQIADLAHLKVLSLQGVPLADGDIAMLKRLPNLTRLELSQTPVGDGAIEHLLALRGLEYLNVQKTNLTDAAEERLLAAFPGLELVRDPPHAQRQAARWVLEQKGRLELATGALIHLHELPPDACQIVKLDLAGVTVRAQPRLGEHLAACTELTHLDLSDTNLTDADLAFLRNLRELVDLRLKGVTGVTDKTLLLLADHEQLEAIDLSGTRVTGSGLAALAKSKDFKSLSLSPATQLESQHVQTIGSFTGLSELDLSGSRNIADGDLAFLGKLSRLQRLGLGRIKISDESVAVIAALEHLEHLGLNETGIHDANVAVLSRLPRLRSIDLSNNRALTDGCIGSLVHMKQLRSVDLRGTGLQMGAIQRLRTEIPGIQIVPPAVRPE
jgi:eukaryotic-like serine/threonine-protein kinase